MSGIYCCGVFNCMLNLFWGSPTWHATIKNAEENGMAPFTEISVMLLAAGRYCVVRSALGFDENSWPAGQLSQKGHRRRGLRPQEGSGGEPRLGVRFFNVARLGVYICVCVCVPTAWKPVCSFKARVSRNIKAQSCRSEVGTNFSLKAGSSDRLGMAWHGLAAECGTQWFFSALGWLRPSEALLATHLPTSPHECRGARVRPWGWSVAKAALGQVLDSLGNSETPPTPKPQACCRRCNLFPCAVPRSWHPSDVVRRGLALRESTIKSTAQTLPKKRQGHSTVLSTCWASSPRHCHPGLRFHVLRVPKAALSVNTPNDGLQSFRTSDLQFRTGILGCFSWSTM